jgi:hypothetical protein
LKNQIIDGQTRKGTSFVLLAMNFLNQTVEVQHRNIAVEPNVKKHEYGCMKETATSVGD